MASPSPNPDMVRDEVDAEDMEEFDEEDEEEEFEEDEEDVERVPDQCACCICLNLPFAGKRMVEVVFRGHKTPVWVAEETFLYPGMVKRFEAEVKKELYPPKEFRRAVPYLSKRAAKAKAEAEAKKAKASAPVKRAFTPITPPVIPKPAPVVGKPPAPVIDNQAKFSRFWTDDSFPEVLPVRKDLPFVITSFPDHSPPYDPFATGPPAVVSTKSDGEVRDAISALLDAGSEVIDLAALASSVFDDHVREIAWTSANLTAISLLGCKNLTKKSFKALGEAPKLTSIDLTEALVPLNGWVIFCIRSAARLRHVKLNRMWYRRTTAPVAGSNSHSGCNAWVSVVLKTASVIETIECLYAQPVLPVEALSSELDLALHSLISLPKLVTLRVSDYHTDWTPVNNLLKNTQTPRLGCLEIYEQDAGQLSEAAKSWPLKELRLGATRSPGPLPFRELGSSNSGYYIPFLLSSVAAPRAWKLQVVRLANLSVAHVAGRRLIALLCQMAPTIRDFHVSYSLREGTGKVVDSGPRLTSVIPTFPLLHSLAIENANWFDDAAVSVLVACCPVLQVLSITGRTTENLTHNLLKRFHTFAPNLRELHITIPNDDFAAALSISGLASLRLIRSDITPSAVAGLLAKNPALHQLELHHTPHRLVVDSKALLEAISANASALRELRLYHCGFRWETNEKFDLPSLRLLHTCGCTVARSETLSAWRSAKNVRVRLDRCVWEHW